MLTRSTATTVNDLQYRLVGAIATLILISLFSSWSGLSLQHDIANGWDGLIWGIADPVLHLDHLIIILAIGLIAAGNVRSGIINISFVLATVLGLVAHLLNFNLPTTSAAIALTTLGFGTILVMPNKPHWLILIILGAMAGLFAGGTTAESIRELDTISLLTYTLGMVLTQYAVAISASKITIGRPPTMIPYVGFGVLAMGIVFCGNLINSLH